MNIQQFKTAFEPSLQAFLEHELEQATRDARDPFLVSILEHTANLARHGGKRVRPYLVWAMHGFENIALGQNPVLPLLIGIELFHTFCLVHDDIMDHGTKRHGQPTIHAYVEAAFRAERRVGDVVHAAESEAILAGDLLYTWAMDSFRLYRGDGAMEISATLSNLMREVIVGQMIDIDLTTRAHASRRQILRKMLMKTAQYSFVRPLQIGAIAAGRLDLLRFCDQFGTNAGLAFQLKDDLLDLIESSTSSLKSRQTDLDQAQHTLITQFIARRGTAQDRKRLIALTHSSTSVSTVDVAQFLVRTGVVAYAKQELQIYLNRAKAALEAVSLHPETKGHLQEIITIIETQSF